MKQIGVTTLIYTDISRDGVLTGVNVHQTARVAQETGLQLIASGGGADLDDVRACAEAKNQGVAGVIIGRALYDNRFQLEDALRFQ